MSSARREVRIAGEAGQGVILAGVILAEAATLDGKIVAQSARYGAAVRGGDATADVVIADEPIDYPHVESPDVLVAISQPTYDQLAPTQREGTLVIHDPFFVRPRQELAVRSIAIGATEAAIRELGKATGANLVLLAALTRLTGIVTPAALERAVVQGVDERFRAKNIKALALGEALAGEAG